MKRLFAVALCALSFAGCCSYSQLARDTDQKQTVDGRKPVATFLVGNVGYSLLGLIPLTSGVTWQEGAYSENAGGVTLFEDRCTLDENLRSVNHACRTVGSDNIANLVTTIDDARAWSFFLVKRRLIKTSCVILEK